MHEMMSSFLRDEDGAVTTDFVSLLGAICMLGLVVVTTISGGATEMANEVETFLNNVPDELED